MSRSPSKKRQRSIDEQIENQPPTSWNLQSRNPRSPKTPSRKSRSPKTPSSSKTSSSMPQTVLITEISRLSRGVPSTDVRRRIKEDARKMHRFDDPLMAHSPASKMQASREIRTKKRLRGEEVSEGSVSTQTASMGGSLHKRKNKMDYSLVNSILKSLGADCNCNHNSKKNTKKPKKSNKKNHKKNHKK